MKNKRNHPWRDFNGPDKPITEEQMKEMLEKQFGIKPRADGKFHREDFEAAWAYYLDGRKT
jgi:hypothetical protein